MGNGWRSETDTREGVKKSSFEVPPPLTDTVTDPVAVPATALAVAVAMVESVAVAAPLAPVTATAGATVPTSALNVTVCPASVCPWASKTTAVRVA